MRQYGGASPTTEGTTEYKRYPKQECEIGVQVCGVVVEIRHYDDDKGRQQELAEIEVAKVGAKRMAGFPGETSRHVIFVHYKLKGKLKTGDIFSLERLSEGTKKDGPAKWKLLIADTDVEKNFILS